MLKLGSELELKPNEKRNEHCISLIKFMKGQPLPHSWQVFNHPRKSIYEYYANSRLHWLSKGLE